jgi:hypothetical protein
MSNRGNGVCPIRRLWVRQPKLQTSALPSARVTSSPYPSPIRGLDILLKFRIELNLDFRFELAKLTAL